MFEFKNSAGLMISVTLALATKAVNCASFMYLFLDEIAGSWMKLIS